MLHFKSPKIDKLILIHSELSYFTSIYMDITVMGS